MSIEINPEYKSILALKSDIEDRWTDTIAMAAAHDIQPEDIQSMIKLQATMAFNLAKTKKLLEVPYGY